MRRYHRAIMIFLCGALAVLAAQAQVKVTPAGQTEYDRGQAALRIGNVSYAVAMFLRAVQLNPEYIPAVKGLSGAAARLKRGMAPELRPSFSTFKDMRAYYGAKAAADPNNAIYQWALGQFDDSVSQTDAERCYNKAVSLSPGFTEAYESLATTLVYRGDFTGARVALLKLCELSPADAEALAAYTLRVRPVNPKMFAKLRDDFFARFPRHIAGAEILAKSAAFEPDLTARIALLEKLKALYPPNENEVSEWNMRFLFDAYNRTNPTAALSLAQEMTLFMPAQSEAGRDWQACAQYAQALAEARSLKDRESFTQVAGALAKAKAPYLVSPDPQTLMLSEAAEASGNTAKAYQTLLTAMAEQPSDALRTALMNCGAKLGRSPARIENEIWTARTRNAPRFKDFELASMEGNRKVRLSEFRGRVVLLRFWNPDDGASREEFPRINEMLEKYQSRGFAVVTVNVYPPGNAIAAILTGRYGFTALSARDPQWVWNAYSLERFPANILIDREGRAISRPEFWGLDPQRTFELEVEAALAQPQKGSTR